MRRLLPIAIIAILIVSAVSLTYADIYLDDAYYWPEEAAISTEADEVPSEEASPAEPRDTVARQTIRFIQVSDTVVKAVIKR